MSDEMEDIRNLLAQAESAPDHDPLGKALVSAFKAIFKAILDLDRRLSPGPSEPAEKTCRTCRFWLREPATHDRGNLMASCCFEPPKRSPEARSVYRPETRHFDLCGRWEHDGVDPEAAVAKAIDELGR